MQLYCTHFSSWNLKVFPKCSRGHSYATLKGGIFLPTILWTALCYWNWVAGLPWRGLYWRWPHNRPHWNSLAVARPSSVALHRRGQDGLWRGTARWREALPHFRESHTSHREGSNPTGSWTGRVRQRMSQVFCHRAESPHNLQSDCCYSAGAGWFLPYRGLWH